MTINNKSPRLSDAELAVRLERILKILEDNLEPKCEHCRKIMREIHASANANSTE